MLTTQRQMDRIVVGIGLLVTHWLLPFRWPRSTMSVMAKLLTHLQTDAPLLVGVPDACLDSRRTCPMQVRSCGPKTAAVTLNSVAAGMLLQASSPQLPVCVDRLLM